MFGEIFGTGILGGFVSFLIAQYVLGKATVAWFFIPPFLVSTIGGSAIACLLIKSGVLNTVMSSSLLRQPSKNTKGGHYV